MLMYYSLEYLKTRKQFVSLGTSYRCGRGVGEATLALLQSKGEGRLGYLQMTNLLCNAFVEIQLYVTASPPYSNLVNTRRRSL